MRAGVGLGWRPATALLCAERRELALTEVIAESIDPRRPPPALMALVERGVPVIPHGVGLSLGDPAGLDRDRLRHLARVARVLRAPLVSEHVAFVRGGGIEAGHLLPMPRDATALAVLAANVRRAQDALPVPLALENIAAPLGWPGDGDEGAFLAALCDRTGAQLLLDVANLLANTRNHGGDARAALATYPLDRVAYVHVAGGAWVDRWWRDTHAHPIAPPVLDLVAAVATQTTAPVLLERDHGFADRAALAGELDAIAAAIARGRRTAPAPIARRAGPAIPTAPTTARALAATQAALVANLVADGPAPAGFAADQLAEARSVLAAKRERVHAAHACHIVRA